MGIQFAHDVRERLALFFNIFLHPEFSRLNLSFFNVFLRQVGLEPSKFQKSQVSDLSFEVSFVTVPAMVLSEY